VRVLTPRVAVGVALGALALLSGALASGSSITQQSVTSARSEQAVRVTGTGPCAATELSDDGVCIRVGEIDYDEGEAVAAVPNGHHEKSGHWRVYDQIPKADERPADYDAYRYPIPAGMAGGHHVVSGYDLDKPDVKQRRSWHLKHVGHGAVDLPQQRGAPIALVPIEHQEGDATLLYDGVLFGNTVITLHTVRESGALRHYALLYGHLENSAAGLRAGMPLAEGSTIGYVGDSGSPNLVHLHLEVRKIREGVDIAAEIKRYGSGALLMDHTAIVCDPRNVLPLKPAVSAAAPSSKH
jgi:murein DD-endopeptidase MepM/ murein hydrolase activator NlpD